LGSAWLRAEVKTWGREPGHSDISTMNLKGEIIFSYESSEKK
jgi:hypothetical protein